MSNEKMLKVIKEVEESVCEREELIKYIAIALLTNKNLFVLGDVGQAKSYVIDKFCEHIVGANRFSTLMSKQTDAEQLFGRLDLASLIPGHVSSEKLSHDEQYLKMKERLQYLLNCNDSTDLQAELKELTEKMELRQKALSVNYGGKPEFITEGKIPDSHIVFLDELFKSNEGILNSLLKALNERVYTNEGKTVKIPVISFFSASNEIPNFNNPEEKILKALYDRFDLKIQTEYVKEKANRLATLKQKQQSSSNPNITTITLDELKAMQEEVIKVEIPDVVNERMDAVLLELRKKDIAVSDRTFFNFGKIVQAEAYLGGKTKVEPKDMMILKNYLWNKPEEISIIVETLTRLCENPVGDRINELTAKAFTLRDAFNTASDKKRALISFKSELLGVYDEANKIKEGLSADDAAISSVDSFISTLEDISRDAHAQTTFTYVTLPELKEYENITK